LSRFPNSIEHRHFAIEHLAAFPRRDAGNYVSAVIHALAGVKRARAPRDALHNKSRILINQNRHKNQESRKRGNDLEARNP
jgi:hypothetical protein